MDAWPASPEDGRASGSPRAPAARTLAGDRPPSWQGDPCSALAPSDPSGAGVGPLAPGLSVSVGVCVHGGAGAGTEDQPCSGPGESLAGLTPGTAACSGANKAGATPAVGSTMQLARGGSGAPPGPVPHLLVMLFSAFS